MNKIICENYDKMSKMAAQIVSDQIKSKPDSVLGLATGSTPIGMYKELVRMFQAGELDFAKVITFNLDEYYRIEKNNQQSYHYFMNEHLFKHININPENTHIPDGNTESVEKECKNYDNMIKKAGGIDLQVLGLGINGHIGFNEPDSELIAYTHLTPLKQKTIQANSRFFNSIDEVPKHAITMGMANILQAKKILLLISGKNKAEIAHKIFNGKITTNIPASFLQLHPDTTVIMDREAAEYIEF